MNQILLCMALGLVSASVTLGGTCPLAQTATAALTSASGACDVTSQDGLVTWTIGNLQLAPANGNIQPGAITVDAAVGTSKGYDQLNLSAQVENLQSVLAANHGFLAIAVDYTLEATSNNPAPEIPTIPGRKHHPAPRPAPKVEFEEFINGQLYSVTSHNRTIHGSQLAGQNLMPIGTTIFVQDLIILTGATSLDSFTNSFDIAPPASGPATPGATPEPGTWALLGVGVSAVAAFRWVQSKR